MPSILPESEPSAWILAQRPHRAPIRPLEPNGFFLEQERAASGAVVISACILLTNKECPWRCLMCDLWKHTLPFPTPPGAVPRQIDLALVKLGSHFHQLKLYNSGSFFDAAAIPVSDYNSIAAKAAIAENIIVESHPRLVGEKAVRFRDLLGRSLEVAMGLETIHPEILPRLNKKFELSHFSKAADFLARNRIGMRAFVLVKPPFMREDEAVEWAVKSVAFAFDCGATAVSLIPLRPGNGAIDRLVQSGEFTPPLLPTLEAAQEASLQLGRGRVFADTWDLQQFSRCPSCFESRRQRLQTVNLTQQFQPAVACADCANCASVAG